MCTAVIESQQNERAWESFRTVVVQLKEMLSAFSLHNRARPHPATASEAELY